MNIKTATVLFVVLLAATASLPANAQNNMFQIGQSEPAKPQNSTPPTAGPLVIQPMTSPIQPTGNPIAPLGGNPRQQPAAFSQVRTEFGNGTITVLPAGGTIFVPAGTLVIEAGPGMQPGTFLSIPPAPQVPPRPPSPPSPGTPQSPNVSSGARGGGTSIDRSNRSTNIGQQASPPDVTRLALGTTRDRVIEKYGNPIAFILNMNGETLYFNGGVVVFVKNGVVADPSRQDIATRP